MKDKKIFIAGLLLPLTILFSGTALASGLQPAGQIDGAPAVQPVDAQTCVNVPIEIMLSGTDSQDDIMLYQLTERPRLGTASIEGSTLTYTPGGKTGKDVFSYTAVDAQGNTARPAEIIVRVDKNRAKLTYADMEGNPAHYAALCLAQADVMTGEQIGGCFFFRPAQTVTRSEFIAMTAAVSQLPISATGQTDFADDSGLSAWAKPFVSAAASNGLVNGYHTAGGLPEIRGQNTITLAEASMVLDNLLSGALDGTVHVSSEEHSGEPDWAARAVSHMSRLEVLPALAGTQASDSPVTRQTACEMLYRVMQLLRG